MTAAPSVSYSITVRLELPARPTAVSELTTVIERGGGLVTALDVTASGADRVRVDVTCAARDVEPRQRAGRRDARASRASRSARSATARSWPTSAAS